ncbi:DUF4446 family protein [Inconstantimicrobium mannanitabidum]|uniref:Uncharacterized protein n=1 Tax=Inconstantimicrobium mannanitabidum TaxID=1604901 RepID=A0ACB5RHB3_9CLOT|nr:DUF4446 family protein [Clostridium sp. TW13]GKX68449.1 hypothetical protein rsdtw13_37070 [Clostridium sp. TW13]
MDQIISTITTYSPYIIIGLSIIVTLLLIIVLIQFSTLNRLDSRYRKMMRGTKNKNLEDLVNSYLDKVDESNSNSKIALDEIANLKNKTQNCIQKVSVIRYKAFEDVGSDLSFSIALLDEKNDGLILTGIYARNESITYAKPIDKGISRYDLSEEEVTVLNEAINSSVK